MVRRLVQDQQVLPPHARAARGRPGCARPVTATGRPQHMPAPSRISPERPWPPRAVPVSAQNAPSSGLAGSKVRRDWSISPTTPKAERPAAGAERGRRGWPRSGSSCPSRSRPAPRPGRAQASCRSTGPSRNEPRSTTARQGATTSAAARWPRRTAAAVPIPCAAPPPPLGGRLPHGRRCLGAELLCPLRPGMPDELVRLLAPGGPRCFRRPLPRLAPPSAGGAQEQVLARAGVGFVGGAGVLLVPLELVPVGR